MSEIPGLHGIKENDGLSLVALSASIRDFGLVLTEHYGSGEPYCYPANGIGHALELLAEKLGDIGNRVSDAERKAMQ